jgi:hypothetical protein
MVVSASRTTGLTERARKAEGTIDKRDIDNMPLLPLSDKSSDQLRGIFHSLRLFRSLRKYDHQRGKFVDHSDKAVYLS